MQSLRDHLFIFLESFPVCIAHVFTSMWQRLGTFLREARSPTRTQQEQGMSVGRHDSHCSRLSRCQLHRVLSCLSWRVEVEVCAVQGLLSKWAFTTIKLINDSPSVLPTVWVQEHFYKDIHIALTCCVVISIGPRMRANHAKLHGNRN